MCERVIGAEGGDGAKLASTVHVTRQVKRFARDVQVTYAFCADCTAVNLVGLPSAFRLAWQLVVASGPVA